VTRLACASRMATILERLARHLASHAHASEEVEPVSASLQVKGHHVALLRNNSLRFPVEAVYCPQLKIMEGQS
jgi:hypothetical protein